MLNYNSVNGINYLMKYGNLYLKPYGYTYYNLSYLTNNIFENNGKIYELIHGQLLNSGINANNFKISMSGNAIISMNGFDMASGIDFRISSGNLFH